MPSSNNRGIRRGKSLADRYERAMVRLGELVEVTFEPWRKLPRPVQAVVLLQVGLSLQAADIVRLLDAVVR